MTLSRLLSVAFACTISLISTSSFSAPPASEGQCDELLGYTPSLYGLCLAYWATHDEAVGTDKPPANRKILERYQARMQTGDPSMPGLDFPCPCWSEEELVAIIDGATGPFFCQLGDEPGWGDIAKGYKVSVYIDSEFGPACSAIVPDGDGLREETHPITDDEYFACAEDVVDSIETIGINSCISP